MSNSAPTVLDAWVESLNAKQTEAYAFDGHCAVLAGPGSGKTRVLVAKVARLLTQRASGPRGVACITLNNEAVREMRKRLGELGLKPSKGLFIGTIHSFCLACIVAPFGHLFREDLASKFSVAGFRQQERTLEKAVDTLGLGGRPAEWKNQFDRYRRTHPFRETDQWREDPQLAELIETYENVLHSQGLLDFDDMILMALDLIRQQRFVRSALEARFPFLVVDEYQDLGYPLHVMVRLLMKEIDIELFAVGDPDQSIYGFTGADPSYLRELAEDSAVHRVQLNMNYRSAQQIIDGSQVALAPEEPRDYRSSRYDVAGELTFKECPQGLDEQARVIATQIIPALEAKGIPSGQITILYIDRRDQLVLSKVLDEAGIKYAGERDQRYPRTPFTRWLEDVAAWCSLFPHTQQGPQLGQIFNTYAEMNEEAGISIDSGDLAARSKFFESLAGLATREMPLIAWLERIEALLNLERCLSARTDHPDDPVDWAFIKGRCQAGEVLAEFTMDDFARCGGRPDTVTLTTLHSSKGLEYEAVIMPGLEEGRLPGYRANSAGAMAEARRVFYVGMTRAKDVIYMLYSGWYKDNYDRIWDKGPSRFVEELQADLRFSS